MGATEVVLAHLDGTGEHLESKAVLDCMSECVRQRGTTEARWSRVACMDL